MKIEKQKSFQPITITLETKEEAQAFYAILSDINIMRAANKAFGANIAAMSAKNIEEYYNGEKFVTFAKELYYSKVRYTP